VSHFSWPDAFVTVGLAAVTLTFWAYVVYRTTDGSRRE
jgi:hypothetical protein